MMSDEVFLPVLAVSQFRLPSVPYRRAALD
jgi:hypothetical protein